MEITAAVLMRKTLLSDTSLIVTWFTEQHGKIKTVAKGARRPKSPFAGKLDLFFDAEIQWIRSKKSELHTLKELVLREPFEGLRAQYKRTQLAAYFVELVELVTEPEHAAPELYELFLRAFKYLNDGTPTKRALLHFESELARLIGIHGQSGATPAVAIGRAFGRLPSSRAALLQCLREATEMEFLHPDVSRVDKLDGLQPLIEAKGEEIFARIAAQDVSQFSGWSARAMEWAMRDEKFKTQLFRFVDVLPALSSAREVVRHLHEYFDDPQHRAIPVLQKLLGLADLAPAAAAWIVRRNVKAMANRFIAGRSAANALHALRRRAASGVTFTVDILGEAVVSEREADDYAARYFDLIETLGAHIPEPNVSIKISALDSQIRSAAPERAIEVLKKRLRPLLQRAQQLGVFVNFDMENFAFKNLTLALFKSLLDEPEFRGFGKLGIVIQAYLRDSERDIEEFIAWAQSRPGQFTVRLVKGAYWDYERVIARQRGWPVPVFEHKEETDANYELLSRTLLQSRFAVHSAFGTHNIRSLAHAIVCAEKLSIAPGEFEFQLLYGMAESVANALVEMGHRVREYAPIGELIPGMGYLVRRLLENTSNESFLRAAFAAHEPEEKLLRDPREGFSVEEPTHFERVQHAEFHNEPTADFTVETNRKRMRAALASARAKFGERIPLLIGGDEISTPQTIFSLDPSDPVQVVAIVAQASRDEAGRAILAAKNAHSAWCDTTAEDRARIVQTAAAIMQEKRFDLAALEVYEAGKPWCEADADVCEAIDFCNFYASEMRRLGHPQMTDDLPGETNFSHYIPRGLGVVIAPWNFPLAILCGMTAAALVTGNCVLMKPSEQTPVIAFRLAKIFAEAGIPRGVLGFLPGPGADIGEFLIEHSQIDFVAFTGSKEVGQKIYAATAKHLAKAVCEMGGKNAMIVDSDADLDEAVAGAITSAFGYAGQKCSALSRLIVLEENYDRFLARLVEAAASLEVGAAENPQVAYGPMIDEAAAEGVRGYVEIGKCEATTAFAAESHGNFVAPVIFTNVSRGARIAREEIFGPVLCVFKARDFDEAIAIANDSEFALTAGIYSRSPANIESAKRELVAGNLYINRPITGAMVKRQPFGGFKMSGTGTKAGGREYLQHFMLPRVVSENVLRRGFAPEPQRSAMS